MQCYVRGVESTSLTALAVEHLEAARKVSSGRRASTVYGGKEHHLRQTLIAMVAGEELAEHSSPGEATLQVLTGRIVLRTPDEHWEISEGEFLAIPDVLHSVEVPEDSVFLLTVAMREAHTS